MKNIFCIVKKCPQKVALLRSSQFLWKLFFYLRADNRCCRAFFRLAVQASHSCDYNVFRTAWEKLLALSLWPTLLWNHNRTSSSAKTHVYRSSVLPGWRCVWSVHASGFNTLSLCSDSLPSCIMNMTLYRHGLVRWHTFVAILNHLGETDTTY